MKRSNLSVASAVTGVLLAGSLTSQALAWHPKGEIVKYVQNVTTGAPLSDANTAATAVSAKPGETLKYVIEVRNVGQPDNGNSNDMAFTVMTDTLPDGVELLSNPSQRTITESLGTIKPGKKVVKEYTVKVTANKDVVILNKACFTGDSAVKDNPQKGCDVANVKVTVPQTPVPPTPEQPKVITPQVLTTNTEQPAELPKTGAGETITLLAIVAAALGYSGRMLRLKRR